MPATPGNSENITAAGLVKFDGTNTFSGVTVTQYDVLVGASSNGITSVAPSATSGVPLISQGASSDPAFGTAVVAGGGTGVATMTTAYAPVCAGTTATGALQVASTGLSTSGYVLTSNGASALPSFQAVATGVTGPESSTDNGIATWNGTGGTALFSRTGPTVSSAGVMQNSAQPAFLYRLNSSVANALGNNTNYVLGTDALTQIFDQASNCTTGGLFTAPVTGIYSFFVCISVQGFDASHTQLQIIGNNGGSPQYNMSTSALGIQTTAGLYGVTTSFLAQLSASDTMQITIYLGGGTQTVTLTGSSSIFYTYFGGYLVA